MLHGFGFLKYCQHFGCIKHGMPESILLVAVHMISPSRLIVTNVYHEGYHRLCYLVEPLSHAGRCEMKPNAGPDPYSIDLKRPLIATSSC
jgi:hypothetical protein